MHVIKFYIGYYQNDDKTYPNMVTHAYKRTGKYFTEC